MRRNLLAHDREQTAAVPPVTPDHSAPISPRPGAREALQQHLGIYAGGFIANEGAARFQESLPVLLPDEKRLELIMRYEAHLSRQLNHALHELEALQNRRRGTAAPLTRLDIN